MKRLRTVAARLAAVFGILAIVVWVAGCQTEPPPFVDVPGLPTAAGGGSEPMASGSYIDVFHIGDLVSVTFSQQGESPITPYEERIKEDGTITPPHVGTIIAVGKKPGELQKELQEKYDKFYKHLTVTVKAGDRYFYVDGEVNRRGPAPYLGETDIIKAISASGGFTDFAKKTKVNLIHPNGKKEIINYNKAMEENLYFPVYPGDKIWVPRRFLF
jgi:protein involved in polysaccharide export with SLBB domain